MEIQLGLISEVKPFNVDTPKIRTLLKYGHFPVSQKNVLWKILHLTVLKGQLRNQDKSIGPNHDVWRKRFLII